MLLPYLLAISLYSLKKETIKKAPLKVEPVFFIV